MVATTTSWESGMEKEARLESAPNCCHSEFTARQSLSIVSCVAAGEERQEGAAAVVEGGGSIELSDWHQVLPTLLDTKPCHHCQVSRVIHDFISYTTWLPR